MGQWVLLHLGVLWDLKGGPGLLVNGKKTSDYGQNPGEQRQGTGGVAATHSLGDGGPQSPPG